MPASKGSPSQTTGIDPPVSAGITTIYNPAAVGTPHAVIFNPGASTVYIGGSAVTASSGFGLPPGAQISLPFANQKIYATDTIVSVGTPNTTLQGGTPAGAGTITLAGTALGTAVATYQIGTGTGAEIVTVSSVSSGTVATLAAPLLFDHLAGATVATIVSQTAGVISVNAGTT